jgi:hypothetical protein
LSLSYQWVRHVRLIQSDRLLRLHRWFRSDRFDPWLRLFLSVRLHRLIRWDRIHRLNPSIRLHLLDQTHRLSLWHRLYPLDRFPRYCLSIRLGRHRQYRWLPLLLWDRDFRWHR